MGWKLYYLIQNVLVFELLETNLLYYAMCTREKKLKHAHVKWSRILEGAFTPFYRTDIPMDVLGIAYMLVLIKLEQFLQHQVKKRSDGLKKKAKKIRTWNSADCCVLDLFTATLLLLKIIYFIQLLAYHSPKACMTFKSVFPLCPQIHSFSIEKHRSTLWNVSSWPAAYMSNAETWNFAVSTLRAISGL